MGVFDDSMFKLDLDNLLQVREFVVLLLFRPVEFICVLLTERFVEFVYDGDVKGSGLALLSLSK